MAETPLRDIMLDIFSRLPAISLAQFRCVCKRWKSLIDDPCLHDMHSARASRSEDKEAVVFLTNWFDGKYSINLDLITEHHTSPKRLLDQFPDSGRYVLANSCNGLVCFSKCQGEEEGVFVCNPLMGGGELFILPPSTVESPRPDLTRYGLGYDSCTKKYKVVRVYVRNYGGNERWCDMGAEVYTMGLGATSSWREINPPPDSLVYMRSVYASGALHWSCEPQVRTGGPLRLRKRGVISFDLREEKFSTIVKEDQFPGRFHLMEVGGHLVVVDLSSKKRIEIWKLKEYEKKEWERERGIDILPLHGAGVPMQKGSIKVVGVMGEEIYYSALAVADVMVGKDGRGSPVLLAAYNTKTNAARVIHICSNPTIHMGGPYFNMHRGTLVSLPSLESPF